MKLVLKLLFIAILFFGYSTSSATELPDALDKALAEAEAYPSLQPSFTMEFQWHQDEKIRLRFNAEKNEWTTLSGKPQNLTARAQKKLTVIKKEAKPNGLLYADFRNHLQHVSLIETTNGLNIYRFTPPEANKRDLPEDIEEKMIARLYVNTEKNILTKYSVRSLQPFSPLPGIRVTEFIVEHEFTKPFDDLPPLQSKMRVRRYGNNFLQKIEDDFTVSFNDYGLIDKY